jgi:hypothetical protein
VCKSVSQGGQRCAAHTRPKLAAKSAAVEAAAEVGDLTALRAAQDEWETAAAEYASTEEGHDHLAAQAASAEALNDFDTSALLNTVIAKGEALRAANRETAALLKAVRLSQTEPSEIPATPAATSTLPAVTEPRGPVVPDLSPADRAKWVAMLNEFEEMAPDLMSVRTLDGYVYPKDVSKDLPEIDEALSNTDASDADVAQAVHLIGYYRGMRHQSAHWKTPDEERDLPLAEQDAADRARSARWQQFAEPFGEVMDAQTQRALSHPNAGFATFEKAEDTYLVKAEQLTARHNVPLEYLQSTIRTAPTTVHKSGWQRARDAAFLDTNNSMAFALAANDPDTFQRHEAFNQVISVPFETVSRADRVYLAQNLYKMPGSEENQRILADSLASWTRTYADAEERTQVGSILSMSNVTAVSNIGQNLMNGSVSLERTEPKPRKRWGF